MDKIKKSSVIFDLMFTTSKLLAYIVVLSSAILGYLLTSTEVVIVGFTVGAALSGVKSMLESKKGNNITKMSAGNKDDNSTENTENNQ